MNRRYFNDVMKAAEATSLDKAVCQFVDGDGRYHNWALDNKALFVLDAGEWRPIRLQDLKEAPYPILLFLAGIGLLPRPFRWGLWLRAATGLLLEVLEKGIVVVLAAYGLLAWKGGI